MALIIISFDYYSAFYFAISEYHLFASHLLFIEKHNIIDGEILDIADLTNDTLVAHHNRRLDRLADAALCICQSFCIA